MQQIIQDDMKKVDAMLQAQGQIKGLNIIKETECVIPGGGKMLRPHLVILSARMCGYDGTDHIDYAVALEMLHNATLFHDDVIDSGELRRGKPTLNARFDNTFAILSGDYLIARSLCIIARHERSDIFKSIAECIDNLVYGELKEMDFEKDLSCGMDDYLEVNDMKTASLFRTCMTVGAMVAQADDSTIKVLSQIGMKTGSLFQIADDILDYLAAEEKTGKKQFQDLREGKMTLPSILFLKFCTKEERAYFRSLIGNADATEEQGKLLLEMMDKYGVVERLHELYSNIQKEVEQLLEEIDGCGFTNDFRELVMKIASRIYVFMESHLAQAKAV